jgi:hypothetical protein
MLIKTIKSTPKIFSVIFIISQSSFLSNIKTITSQTTMIYPRMSIADQNPIEEGKKSLRKEEA